VGTEGERSEIWERCEWEFKSQEGDLERKLECAVTVPAGPVVGDDTLADIPSPPVKRY